MISSNCQTWSLTSPRKQACGHTVRDHFTSGHVYEGLCRRVNWDGKTHSQSSQHQCLGWDAELRKWTEHQHSSLCFRTTPTLWPTVPSLDFSTIMDYSFELWTEISPYSLEVLSSVYFSTAANITLSNVPTDIPGKLARNAVFQLSPFCRSLSHIRHFNWSEWLICALMFRSMIAKSAT